MFHAKLVYRSEILYLIGKLKKKRVGCFVVISSLATDAQIEKLCPQICHGGLDFEVYGTPPIVDFRSASPAVTTSY